MTSIEVDISTEEKLWSSLTISSSLKVNQLPPSLNSTNSLKTLILTKTVWFQSKKWQDSWDFTWLQTEMIYLSKIWPTKSSWNLTLTEVDISTREKSLLCLTRSFWAKTDQRLLSHNSTDSLLNTMSMVMESSPRLNVLDSSKNSLMRIKTLAFKTKLHPLCWTSSLKKKESLMILLCIDKTETKSEVHKDKTWCTPPTH